MNPFRSLFSVLMALLVVWPACCCAVSADGLAEPTANCCSSAGDKDSPDPQQRSPHVCTCRNMEPRETAKHAEPPAPLPAPAVFLTREPVWPMRAAVRGLPAHPAPDSGGHPPPGLLARLCRWLI